MITILWLGIFQCLFFVALLLNNKSKNAGNFLMIIWLVIFSIHLGLILLLTSGSSDTFIVASAKTMSLLHGPFLYLYTRKTLEEQEIKAGNYLHFLVFLLPFIYLLLQHKPADNLAEIGLVSTKIISISIYVLITFRMVNNKIVWLKNETADSLHLQIKWIKTLALLFMVSTLISILYLGIDIFKPGSFMQIIDSIFYDLLIVLMGYFGIQHRVIYTNEQHHSQQHYSNSPLNDLRLQQLIDHVRSYLHDKRPYNEPGFDLSRLSRELDIPRHHLSEVLNKGMGQNFYELINSMRIDEAIRLIKAGTHQHLSIEGLGYEVGFNSKSAFFTHFKKQTGLTPLQYQKQVASGSD